MILSADRNHTRSAPCYGWSILLALGFLICSGCATQAGYTPGKLDADQMKQCRAVAQAYVDTKPEYSGLLDDLRADPVALAWFVRYLESEIVGAREGQAELLGEEKVRMDRVKAMQGQKKDPVQFDLPGQRADMRAASQIIAIGGPAVDVVVNDLVLSSQEFLRAIGIELLTGIGDPAVPALLRLASSGGQQQQRVAARALGEVGAVGASFDALRELSRSPVWRVRSDAAKGLASGGPAARDLLVEMLGDEDSFVRRMAVQSLAGYRSGPVAAAIVDYLQACQKSEDRSGELSAQKALQSMAGVKSPRTAVAWRRFADEMSAGENGR